jgi:hypothetical protein
MGVNKEEFTKKIRPDNFEVGKGIMTEKTFTDRFNEFTDEQKLELLGRGRFEYIKSGKLEFQDLVNVETGELYKLDELDKILKNPVLKSDFDSVISISSLLTDLGSKTHTLPRKEIPSMSDLSGLSVEREKLIFDGLRESVGDYDGKLHSVGWQNAKEQSLGSAMPDGSYIRFNKKYADDLHELTPEWKKSYDTNLQNAITKATANGDEAKLKDLNKHVRMFSYHDAKDPLKAIASHEGFHNIYHTHKLEDKFKEALKSQGISLKAKSASWYGVSDYAATNLSELFAEVGASITNNIKIPEPFVNAFNQVVKDIKK